MARHWGVSAVMMAASLAACVELPALPERDAGAALDSGSDGGSEGDQATARDAALDGGDATLPTACVRPEAAALRFRAFGDVMVLDEASVTPFGSAFTLEVWLRPRRSERGNLTGGTLFARKDEADGSLVVLLNYGTLASLCIHRDTSLATRTVCSSAQLPPDVWLHAAFTVDGTSARIWINGVESASGDLLTPLDPLGTPLYGTTVGGAWRPSEMVYAFPVSGDIDELALHRSVRYQAPFVPPARLEADASTVGLYRLDERGGTLAYDESGHAAPATIHQSEWLDGCERRAHFGDGLDGPATVQGRLELARDMEYDELHITSTGDVLTHGHVVRVRRSALIEGRLRDDGAPGAPGGRVDLRASRVAGAGTLSARGGESSAAGDADGAPGGEVRVVTEDPALPVEMSVSVEGGAASGAGAPGAAGSVEVVSVVVP